MRGKQYVGPLIYLGLLACALVYVKNSIDEYMSGRTLYSDTQETISLYDIPTITFKLTLNLRYGDDFIIQILQNADESQNEESYKTIPINQSTKVLISGGNFKAKVDWMDHLGDYKLSLTCEDKSKGQSDFISFFLQVKFLGVPGNYMSWNELLKEREMATFNLAPPTIYFTTEENSYGITKKRWYDGKVVGHKLFFSHYHEFTVKEVTEYVHMEETCSHESYFQCLANRFASINLDQLRLTKKYREPYELEGTLCPFKRLCSPTLLPFDSEVGIPVCNNDLDFNCFEKVLQDMKRDQQDYCKKLCHAKEFKTIQEKTLDYEGYEVYDLFVKFGFPDSSINVRPSVPFKTVKTEYLVVSWMSLLGNVGGTLGMFVGFSVIGASEWCLDCLGIVRKLWKWLSAKCQTKPNQLHSTRNSPMIFNHT